jgi:hypothetical protein
MTSLPVTPFHARQVPRFSDIRVERVAVQGRYKVSTFRSMLTGSLQGIAERPLPCIYNEIFPLFRSYAAHLPGPIQRLSLLRTLTPGGIPGFVRGSKVELRPRSHDLNFCW